jgi:hypothetical protein
MTTFLQSLAKAVTTAIAVVLSRTTSTVSSAFDTLDYEGLAVITLDAGAATAGTLPTLDVKITTCATSGGSYTDVTGAAFTQVTTVAGVQTLTVDLDACKRYIKADWTIGGTVGPAFPFGVNFTGIKKYAS